MNHLVEQFINQPIVSITGLEKGSDRLVFQMMTGTLTLEHEQDCCERVVIEDFEGDLEELVGQVLLEAEEVTNGRGKKHKGKAPEWADSYTWTFYKFRTTKGRLWVRWLGESNGYYSERVSSTWSPINEEVN